MGRGAGEHPRALADPIFTVKQHLNHPDFTVNESEHAAQIFLHLMYADVRWFWQGRIGNGPPAGIFQQHFLICNIESSDGQIKLGFLATLFNL